MHNQKHSNRKTIAIIITTTIVLLVGAGTYFTLRNADIEPAPAPKPALFSFDAAKAPGWHKSPLDTSSTQGRRSLLVFDYDFKSPSDKTDMKSCHMSAFLNPGTVDIDAKRKAIEQMQFDDRKASLVDTLDLSLQMTSDSKKYTLYRYNFTGGSEKFKNGNAFGYIKLNKYHIEVQVICDTFEQVDSATDALKAIKFDDKAPRE